MGWRTKPSSAVHYRRITVDLSKPGVDHTSIIIVGQHNNGPGVHRIYPNKNSDAENTLRKRGDDSSCQK